MERDVKSRLKDLPRVGSPIPYWDHVAKLSPIPVTIAFGVLRGRGFEVAAILGEQSFVAILGLGAVWNQRAWNRRLRDAAEERLRSLGLPVPSRDPGATPPTPFPFLGNRDSLALRATQGRRLWILVLVTFAIVVSTVSMFYYGGFRLNTWDRRLPGWHTVISICAAAELIVCFSLVWAAVLRSVRRSNADLARFEALRRSFAARNPKETDRHSKWPLVLFGFEWIPGIDRLPEAWLGSRAAAAHLDPKYRALERVVTWLKDVRLMPNATLAEKAVHRTVLRDVAWALATELDPTLAEAFTRDAQRTSPMGARGALA